MSVKRYVLDENALMGGMEMFEDDEGDYVFHSDYAALRARHNALREAVGKVVEMHRKGEGHVCTHYPSGRRALDALAALVGEE